MKSASPNNRLAAQLLTLKAPGKGLLAAYFAFSLLAVLYIPYFFPVRPSTSDSYIFGYNNAVGIVLLLLLASVGAIWTRGLNFNFAAKGPSPKVPLKYLWLALGVEFTACMGMYLTTGRYGAFAEAQYQINGIRLLFLGKSPNVDFEWAYGKGFLYFPRWLSAFAHLSIPNSYFVFWTGASLAGVVLLFVTINLIDFPSRQKTSIFSMFCISAFLSVPNMGVSYSLLRYLCPIFFELVIYRMHHQSRRQHAKMHAAILAILFTAILMLISPEVTIAFAFATTIVLFPKKSDLLHLRSVTAYIATLTVLAILFACGLNFHVFDIVRTQGYGSNSFPITFAPAILMFFCAVFICACYVVQRVSRSEIQDNTITLIAFSTPMMVAALGRCDPGHVLFNGVGFFLAVFFYASTSSRIWKIYRTGFVSCFLVITPLFGFLYAFHFLVVSGFPIFPGNADVPSLYPGIKQDAILQAPFGYLPRAKRFYFSANIDQGFYDSLLDATTPDAYQRKISELEQHPERNLLLMKHFTSLCEVNENREQVSISILFAFPYVANAMNRESIRKPLCEYILDHYTLVVPGTSENFQYELWKPKL